MVLCGRLRLPMEIARESLPRRMKLGSAAPRRWRLCPPLRRVRWDMELPAVAGGRRSGGGFGGICGGGVGSRLHQLYRNWLGKIDVLMVLLLLTPSVSQGAICDATLRE